MGKHNNNSEVDILDTWKEIAGYVRKDIRTCQRWEKELDFPIYRLKDSPKSRVYSYKDEIDAWIKDKGINNNNSSPYGLSKLHLGAILFISLIVFAGLIYIAARGPNSKDPLEIHEIRLENSKLVVLDVQQELLWMREIDLPDLEKEYKTEDLFHAIRDINNDGSKEILYAGRTTDQSYENKLTCFSNRGKELWSCMIASGQEDRVGEKPKDCYIHDFVTDDINNDGKSEVLIVANHESIGAGVLKILDSKGKLLKVFEHTDRFDDCIVYDIDEDGIKDVVVSGFNEMEKLYSCLILDISPIFEKSHRTRDLVNKESPNNLVKYSILFPKLTENIVSEDRNRLFQIETDIVGTGSFVKFKNLFEYTLNSRIELVDASPSLRFLSEFRKRAAEGRTKKNMHQLIQELHQKGLLFHDGRKWTKTNMMTEYWAQKQKSRQNFENRTTRYLCDKPDICWTGKNCGAVWRNTKKKHPSVHFEILSPLGFSLCEIVQLSEDWQNVAEAPSITWNDRDKEYAVCFQVGDPAEWYFMRVSSAGEKIGDPKKITSDYSDSALPDIEWTGDKYAVIWFDYKTSLKFMTLKPDGTPDSGPVTITDGFDPRYPKLVWNPDRQECALDWNAVKGGKRNIFFAIVELDGSVKKMTQITRTLSWSESPSLVWTGKEYGLSWQDDRDGNLEIYFTRVDSNGDLITPEHNRITNSDQMSRNVSLAWSGKEYGIIYDEGYSNYSGDISFYRVGSSGEKIGEPINITSDLGSEAKPVLIWVGNGYGVIWAYDKNGNRDIHFDVLHNLSSIGN